ncbi:neutral alpha-glucosidase C-like [Cyanistes caeruleus]|uniref:neutral alpha-glucosidase C-like n=1 Tax=Cyanistes caeruleus TaxID=156563 RepID=UPI000CDB9C67|nr:neutral alpha-glucosidase C-like [Cyanistes caeruleus]
METFDVENEYMLGNALLVHPVTEKEAKTVTVLFPGPEEIWYDFRKFKRMEDAGTVKIPVTLENVCFCFKMILSWSRKKTPSSFFVNIQNQKSDSSISL